MILLAIIINIDPNLLQLGPLTLSWHGLFSAVGVIAGVSLGVRVAAEAGADEEKTYNLALWSVGGGIIGARIFHVVDFWSYYAANPIDIIKINEGGIAIYGAVVGGILTGVTYAIRSHLPVAKVADGGGIGLILGAAIGRIGDVINGEHHGRATSVPWAVEYTHPNTLGEIGIPVHLAVGYEMLWDIGVFAVLMYLRGRVRDGVIFWLYVLLYSIGRLWTTFFRIDQIWAFGLTQAQLIAVAGIIVSIPMLVKLLYLTPRPAAPTPSEAEPAA